MATEQGSERIRSWPEASREAARLVIDEYGEPDEVTDSQLIWYRRGPWKRVVARKEYVEHNFPAPHTDSVECAIDYHVPPDKFTALAEFDGSVVAERTSGEVFARCHDEQANLLALNLMHDIVTGSRGVREAREYYAKEFADFRRNRPTPYMEKLQFHPAEQSVADPDDRLLSDEELEQAAREGRQGG